ncbi:unnamed protein product [Sphagnum jensenii]
MKVKDVIRKGRGVRRGSGLDEVDAEILVGSSACQNLVGSTIRANREAQLVKIERLEREASTGRAGYMSLLMATEQVNGIVRVTWTRATFQEFIASSMAESSWCFRNCNRNSVRRMVLVTGLYPL